ncbi:alkane 1-monooxygenase [Alphaproteobacteria bacterium GH1-50]|uniref:Alkane 1-monooxygenase n=1 Tax=Kangsaoukella pontilimi TaxID=2691042 RepID=A0A7C9IU49_9RHOB|nr:alkane 1-monooxygenase [Kangsaoukella pontilimi]MXQ09425.1 alkane 1-monooxygenase [Kangsaoukella pontilimi]
MSDTLSPMPARTGLANAAPFWLSLMLVPVVWLAAVHGGWVIFLVPVSTWALFGMVDTFLNLAPRVVDPGTPDGNLFWHRAITLIWAPVQGATIFGVLYYLAATDHTAWYEELGIAFGLGVMSGTIGIVYAHELMHQPSRVERWLGDILMAMALYGHFRSEHLLVHHRYVATPKDTVTARYNENFHRFFLRVLRQGLTSAWDAERTKLARKGLPVWNRANAFWTYGALQLGFLTLALLAGGVWGVVLFAFQALAAIWQLELVNYVEHYGLTRKHLGDGRYEPTGPQHSWNADHQATNWLLINLQRHSDHHYKPARRFPLLQSRDTDEAPQLPYSYAVMTTMALFPRLWRSRMNPRVRAWRRQFYPEIVDWSAYNTMSTPMPR